MSKNTIELKVDGMTCNHCAQSVHKFLERKGLEDVVVNFATKEVRFKPGGSIIGLADIKKGIEKLGFTILEAEAPEPFWTLEKKLFIAAFFTLPLFLNHMGMMFGLHVEWLHNYWVQFAICLPVFLIGIFHFGVSAWHSVRSGSPNMDVLIFTGSTAAFIYSLIGTFLQEENYIFYETAAMIITLVLLGNYLEKRAVRQTTSAVEALTKLKVEEAKMKVGDDWKKVKVSELNVGDILQVNEGDKIPVDGEVIQGNAWVDESMISGESRPVEKNIRTNVIGATIVQQGNLQMKVTKIGQDTVLSQIIDLVKSAQSDKPELQRLGDQISAIFVPAVLLISLLTFLLSYFLFDISFQNALMNSIAVLVISCPCAMGLATPTAVMVGVGKLAKEGIIVKGGSTIEQFSNIKNIIFDKTGTLTTGEFKLNHIHFNGNDNEIAGIIIAMEKISSHPIAQSLELELKQKFPNYIPFNFIKINEMKGNGIQGEDAEGNQYRLGKAIWVSGGKEEGKEILLSKNEKILARMDIGDSVKSTTASALKKLSNDNMNLILLSGDQKEKVKDFANQSGIQTYYGGQVPEDKLHIVEKYTKNAPTAMVGDGINDAPALSKATVGISVGGASQIAVQSAQMVLLKDDLNLLDRAFKICKATVQTIRQNLFWAFSYNIIAIPLAALGFLNPMWGALFMAFSDIVVIGNSLRLKGRKV